MIKCLNCDTTYESFDNIVRLWDVKDIFQRIDPGEEVPAGECPECHALCHIIKPEKKIAAIVSGGIIEVFTENIDEDIKIFIVDFDTKRDVGESDFEVYTEKHQGFPDCVSENIEKFYKGD